MRPSPFLVTLPYFSAFYNYTNDTLSRFKSAYPCQPRRGDKRRVLKLPLPQERG